jgi:hypothetical protein
VRITYRRSWFVLVAGVLMAARAGAARATDTDLRSSRPATLSQEMMGLELTPASMALGHSTAASSSRFDAGLGGGIRFFRRSWEHFYLTPFQANLYVSSTSDTLVAHIQTEAGVIVPRTARHLELGLGAGLGVIAIDYPSYCEAETCHVGGGVGWTISGVARYRLVDRPDLTTGVGLRAILFPFRPSDLLNGGIVLVVFDFAAGRPATAPATTDLPHPPVD